MNVTEIILLLFGVILFIASFVIPEKVGKLTDADKKISEEAVKTYLNTQIEQTQSQIQDLVDETVSYSMEKTERTLDRLTNEKMQAVNEYSDTVLTEINKNHKEVMFLYDMLNDKQENLKDTVQNVQQTVKAATTAAESVKKTVIEKKSAVAKETVAAKETTAEKEVVKTKQTKKTKQMPSNMPLIMGTETGKNNNEQILLLHKAGKSKMAIAKELGLGVGEVKLVIDLFEGM